MRARIRNFFFPPAGSSRWVRILPYALLGVLTLVVLIGGVYAWDYTNSPSFCGTTCHTMPPEYTAYLTSPHAQVDCVECHIGRGFIATRISRKAGDLEHVFDTTFHNYEFPIRARKMRPASDSCEKCHSPQKFSDDSLREIRRFGTDAPRIHPPALTWYSRPVAAPRGKAWAEASTGTSRIRSTISPLTTRIKSSHLCGWSTTMVRPPSSSISPLTSTPAPSARRT